jgi:hypothetical protein
MDEVDNDIDVWGTDEIEFVKLSDDVSEISVFL